MVVHTLQCTECNAKRIGRDTSDGITPIQDACPDCGEKSYEALAAKRSD